MCHDENYKEEEEIVNMDVTFHITMSASSSSSSSTSSSTYSPASGGSSVSACATHAMGKKRPFSQWLQQQKFLCDKRSRINASDESYFRSDCVDHRPAPRQSARNRKGESMFSQNHTMIIGASGGSRTSRATSDEWTANTYWSYVVSVIRRNLSICRL